MFCVDHDERALESIAAKLDPQMNHLGHRGAPIIGLEGNTVRFHVYPAFTAGFVPGDDVLGFTDQPNVTGSYDAGTGNLTWTGTSLLANYQAALRSVTYRNTNSFTGDGKRTVSFVVNDGAASSNVATRSIEIRGTIIN